MFEATSKKALLNDLRERVRITKHEFIKTDYIIESEWKTDAVTMSTIQSKEIAEDVLETIRNKYESAKLKSFIINIDGVVKLDYYSDPIMQYENIIPLVLASEGEYFEYNNEGRSNIVFVSYYDNWKWFSRSGSVLIMMGSLLAFRNIIRLTREERIAIRNMNIIQKFTSSEKINQEKDSSATIIGVILMVLGTLIWAYGDLF